MHHDGKALARRALSLVDLTELSESADETAIAQLCATARGDDVVPATAAVCIPAAHVATAKSHLAGSNVLVATVVDFPGGRGDRADIVAQTRSAVADGADEIDYVFSHERFVSGEEQLAGELVAAVREASAGRALKVILETGVLIDPRRIGAASRLAIENGADFIKTSTGRTPVSATPDAVAAMAQAVCEIGRGTGIKVSGGLRSLEQVQVYLALVERIVGPVDARRFRFGASGLHGTLAAILREEESRSVTTAY